MAFKPRTELCRFVALPSLIFATALLPVDARADDASYHSRTVTVSVEEDYFFTSDTLEDSGMGNGLTLGNHSAPGTRFGPFRILDANHVEMDGAVESDTPDQFRRMLALHPGLREIRMVECPGSDDDDANLELAHLVRSAGLSTYVPANGSVRSGAVELFLAGRERHAEPGAEFAVHSWRDEDGHEANDFAANDPVHRPYLDYYREIGMTAQQAIAFYALTNSVSFDAALYLRAKDIARYASLN